MEINSTKQLNPQELFKIRIFLKPIISLSEISARSNPHWHISFAMSTPRLTERTYRSEIDARFTFRFRNVLILHIVVCPGGLQADGQQVQVVHLFSATSQYIDPCVDRIETKRRTVVDIGHFFHRLVHRRVHANLEEEFQRENDNGDDDGIQCDRIVKVVSQHPQ